MKTAFGILCFFLLSRTSVAGELIGTIVPPFPDGWNELSGACISEISSMESTCAYSISIEKDSNNQRTILFGKSMPRIDQAIPRWLIIDQMPYPRVPLGFHISYGECETNGNRDQSIIAVVQTTNTEWYTIVRQAYRANLNSGRLEKISTHGIRCRNEGWEG